MSQENVEVVRRLIQGISDRDYAVVPSCLEPDAQWNNTRVFPDPITVVGVDAIEEFVRDLFEAYRGGDSGIEIEELTEAGETVVVGLYGWGRGASSGAPIETHWAHVIRFRGSKVVRVDTFGRLSTALEVAGLQE